jgi:hypothetical protein
MWKLFEIYKQRKHDDVSEKDLLTLEKILPTHRYTKIKNNPYNKDKILDEAKIEADNQKEAENIIKGLHSSKKSV